MYGLTLGADSDAVEYAMHYYGQRLRGTITTMRNACLRELFSGRGEPTPAEIFATWQNRDIMSAEDARKRLTKQEQCQLCWKFAEDLDDHGADDCPMRRK